MSEITVLKGIIIYTLVLFSMTLFIITFDMKRKTHWSFLYFKTKIIKSVKNTYVKIKNKRD